MFAMQIQSKGVVKKTKKKRHNLTSLKIPGSLNYGRVKNFELAVSQNLFVKKDIFKFFFFF